MYPKPISEEIPILKWFGRQQILCQHQYEKIGFSEAHENGVRYSIRSYRCSKCGKEILVDGRYDTMKG